MPTTTTRKCDPLSSVDASADLKMKRRYYFRNAQKNGTYGPYI